MASLSEGNLSASEVTLCPHWRGSLGQPTLARAGDGGGRGGGANEPAPAWRVWPGATAQLGGRGPSVLSLAAQSLRTELPNSKSSFLSVPPPDFKKHEARARWAPG